MKKKIISIITTMLITGSLAMNTYASNLTNVTEFSDYNTLQSHWGLNDINVLVSKNGIRGIPNDDGTFRFEPDREITTAELLSLILNAAGIAPTEGEWPTNVMEKAVDRLIIPSNWNNGSLANEPIPRERMAYVLSNSAYYILGENVNLSEFDVDPDKIADIGEANSSYKNSILNVYDYGLIAGTGEGFNPKGKTTRAEACAIVNRLFRYTDRVDNSALEYEDETVSSTPQVVKPGIGMYGAVTAYPKEGDMFNGQPITRDPETGVLGYGNGQKGGIYLGVDIGNRGVKIKVNSFRPEDLPCQEPLAKGYYTQKGDYVYWDDEWAMIKNAGLDKLRAEHPDAPQWTCADIYGNILEGVTDYKSNDVFFVVSVPGHWQSTK